MFSSQAAEDELTADDSKSEASAMLKSTSVSSPLTPKSASTLFRFAPPSDDSAKPFTNASNAEAASVSKAFLKSALDMLAALANPDRLSPPSPTAFWIFWRTEVIAAPPVSALIPRLDIVAASPMICASVRPALEACSANPIPIVIISEAATSILLLSSTMEEPKRSKSPCPIPTMFAKSANSFAACSRVMLVEFPISITVREKDKRCSSAIPSCPADSTTPAISVALTGSSLAIPRIPSSSFLKSSSLVFIV